MTGGDLPWGFARGMPSLAELLAAAGAAGSLPARGGAADRGADPDADEAQGSRATAGLEGGAVSDEAGVHQSLYMRRLQDSRAFHCPDATECMAEALGAKDALQSLQVGSICHAVPFRWSPRMCLQCSARLAWRHKQAA